MADKNLMYDLPEDIQGLIWRKYFTAHVLNSVIYKCRLSLCLQFYDPDHYFYYVHKHRYNEALGEIENYWVEDERSIRCKRIDTSRKSDVDDHYYRSVIDVNIKDALLTNDIDSDDDE